MGIGAAEGEGRATRAAEEAIVCPLLEQSDVNGAKGVIVNIKGGCDITMREVQEAVSAVQKSAHTDANIIFGAVVGEEARPELQVTVIAAGFPKQDLSDEVLRGAAAGPPAEEVEAARKDQAPEAITLEPPQEPEVQYLFPEEGQNVAEPGRAPDTDEDLDIPAFMRRRKKENR
jgi:cell division protein FtsZ